jgi:surface antigen
MSARRIFAAAAAALVLGVGAANAQPPIYPPPGGDPDGYYSRVDPRGYYDRDGNYRRIRPVRDRDYGPPPPPPPSYYEEGRYEQDCHRGNQTAGTIFGALAGAAIGAGVSRGNGGAAIGGAVLGGLLGNTIAGDIDCEDQPYAFRVYADGLNGDIGRRYEWRHRNSYGYFTPVREFRRGGMVCREFTETTWRGGRSVTRTGTACRETGGNWRFD